ncbi:TetR/AcrR family transcriptional regulator [Stutzerimonas kunmingensis]|uniref:TetR/AcrR family transcriptional regulator n=1 Tax=Stutzerimonas kunmingensis TaxID=1211807 RepID=UPI00241D9CAD|nr:TetR/AcrR family transcriptional regulator [Stutzerimonas kunmingensis]
MTKPSPATPSRRPRASSQARIRQILSSARELLAEQGAATLSVYAVAERAGIPPSSVYHFFSGVPALLAALTADVHATFRDSLEQPIDHQSLSSWRDLSRLIEQRMLGVYEQDSAARQLILVQHGLGEVTQTDQRLDLELGQAMQAVFERHFALPPLPQEIDVFAMAVELGDRVYARSIQLYGSLTPRMAEEGLRVFDAYLGLYLPPCLPKRETPSH